MFELVRSALPFYAVSMALLCVVALSSVMRPGWRVAVAVGLLLAAIGALALAVTSAGTVLATDVVNPFPRGPGATLTPVVMEQATAPSWMPWAAVAATLLFPAVLLLLRRHLEPKPAHPYALGVTLCLWVLGARLMLEKAAAPQPWVWAVGLTPALFVILPIAGAYAAYRGMEFLEFVLALLLMAITQRAIVTTVSFFATTRELGTHLDMNSVTDMTSLLGGARTFGPDEFIAKWLYAAAIPQMVLWVVVTVLVGTLLGGVAFAIGRRRAGY